MSQLQPTHMRTSSLPILPTLSSISSGMSKIRRSLRSKKANVEIRINVAGDSSKDFDAPIERRPSEMMTGNVVMDVSNGTMEVEGMWVGLEGKAKSTYYLIAAHLESCSAWLNIIFLLSICVGTIKSTMPQEGNNDPLYTSSHGQHIHHKVSNPRIERFDEYQQNRSPYFSPSLSLSFLVYLV